MTKPVIETVRGVRLSRILPSGVTRPFVFHDEKDRAWVGKAISSRAPASHVASEILCGRLAAHLGVPWPRTTLVRITTELLSDLRDNGIDVMADVCVATEFLDNLRGFTAPSDYGGPEDNRRYMEERLRQPHRVEAFYRKGLLDTWVGMEDDKYSNLKVDADGSPVFLDGDTTWITLAFENADHAHDELPIAIDVHSRCSVFLRGILTESELFRPALDRVEAFEGETVDRLLESLPPELEPLHETRLVIQKRLAGEWRSRMVDELRRKIAS